MTDPMNNDLLELRRLDELFVEAVVKATNLGLAAKEAEVLHGDQLTARRLYEKSRQALDVATDLEALVQHQMAEMLAGVDGAEPVLGKVLQFPMRLQGAIVEIKEELAAARIHDRMADGRFRD